MSIGAVDPARDQSDESTARFEYQMAAATIGDELQIIHFHSLALHFQPNDIIFLFYSFFSLYKS